MTDARERQADALIDHLQREQGGRLTIFLGAAPGVGKTYTMLSRARELRRQGRDVVVGIVETHGRGETAALTEGLEILPRRRIAYQQLQGVELARYRQLQRGDLLLHRFQLGLRLRDL